MTIYDKIRLPVLNSKVLNAQNGPTLNAISVENVFLLEKISSSESFLALKKWLSFHLLWYFGC